MAYRFLADAVVVVHIGFVLFVGVGGFLAWRWPRLIVVHAAAVAWGAGIVAIGWTCPLTPLEKWLRRLGGEASYEGGFVDRYLENVVYPGALTPYLRLAAAVAIAVAWVGWSRRRRAPARRTLVSHPHAP
ncbi:MAG: DUF2784 domain-containing protein [Acidimicrobiales bacterium]